MSKRIITINNWKRPDMYRQVLEGLATNPEINNYEIISVVDPHPNKLFNMQFRQIDERFNNDTPLNITSLYFKDHMGCAGAKRQAFKAGFSRDVDFVINLEDDIIPGASFLHYMEYCDKMVRCSPLLKDEIHAVIGWSRTMKENPKDFSEIQIRTPDKTYQAFGIWRHTWEQMGEGDDWFGIQWNEKVYKPKDGEGHTYTGEEFMKRILKTDKGSWGWPMLNYWRRGRKCLIPTVSRCQNIGDRDGAFNFDPSWHEIWIHNPVWAEERVPPTFYAIREGR